MVRLLRNSGATLSGLCLPRTSSRGLRTLSKQPELPDSVKVPRPIQPFQPYQPDVRGTLPAAREIFPRNRPDKPSASYLEDATPEALKPKLELPPTHPDYETHRWRRRMTERRKGHLVSGLTGLYRRQQLTNLRFENRTKAKMERMNKVLTQPPRDDERLMAPSKLQGVLEMISRAPWENPRGEERLKEATNRWRRRQGNKRRQRLEAMHTLYMNARRFITTEKQLVEEINKVFPDGQNPDWELDSQPGKNIWNLGPPPSIEQMIEKRFKDDLGKHRLAQERTKQIAEKLTGGKI